MGTWGTGPFDSDIAEDFTDALEQLSADQRLVALERVFSRAIEAAESEKFPGEIVAAAAVVAANLPQGLTLSWNEDYPGVHQWLLKPVPPELCASAVRALVAALPASGWFWRSWVDDEDRRQAQDTVDRLKVVLGDS